MKNNNLILYASILIFGIAAPFVFPAFKVQLSILCILIVLAMSCLLSCDSAGGSAKLSCEVKKILYFDKSFNLLWKKLSRQYDVINERNSNFLNWRYLSRPDHKYYCFKFENKNEILGYVVLKIYRFNKIKTGHFIDIFCNQFSKGIFKDIPNPYPVVRYHSLIIEKNSMPNDLEITCVLEDNSNIIMGIQHKEFPIFGVQFHPESIDTEHGMQLIENFIAL